MKELLEKILGEIKKTPEGVRAYEDLYHIATDTKRQADKKEQTIVKVGNRTINDAVTTQKEANGFSFTE